MRACGKLSAAVMAAVLSGAMLMAQSAPPPIGEAATMPTHPSSSVLRLSAFLTGSGSENLQKADVTLLDNGSAVPVEALLPPGAGMNSTQVILVIDDVNAPLTTVAYERGQLQKFFQRQEGRLKVPLTVAVMTDTKMDIQPGFSQDGNAINQSLQNYGIGLHEIRRDSQWGFLDRTNICLQRLEQLVQYAGTVPGHKLILFISPGWPLLSGPRVDLTAKEQSGIFGSLTRLQDSMLAGDVTLDMLNPIGPGESLLRTDYYQSFLKAVKKPGQTDIADLSLQVLSTHSGGLVQQGSNDIDAMVQKAMTDLDSRYTVAFVPRPAEDSGGYHSLKLQVNRPGVTVRMADDYYTRVPGSQDKAY